jgi:transposase
MGRVSKAISASMLEACKAELKKQGVRGENGRRLQAIISAKEHGISEVAKIYNISRETLMRWIRKFNQGGVDLFAVQSGRGRRYKLSDEQKLMLKEHIELSGSTLTCEQLQHKVREEFDVEISNSTAYRLLKELGFSYMTARPIHHKKEQQSQVEFKKKS